MVVQELHHLQRVLHVTVDAQGQRLQAQQQQPCVERGERGALVAQQRGAGLRDVGCGAGGLGEHHAVVAGVGLCHAGELIGVGGPVERAGVGDHAAHRRAVAADELRGGVDDHVGTVLDGAQQVGSGEGCVHDQRHVVAVRDIGPGLKVEHVGVRVAKRLGVEQLGVVLDGGLDGVQIGRVDERGGKPLLGQRVLEQVQRAAVQVGGGHDMVAGRGDVLHGDGDGGRTGRHAQGSDAALERGNALLEGADRGVGQAAVDVAGLG